MVEEIKNNNPEVFEFFFNKYNECLFFYFLKKTKSYPDAEELTQQTFIKFWEYRSSLSTEVPEKIQLFHKARLVLIDWLRKQATMRKLYENLSHQAEPAEELKDNFNYEESEQLIKKLHLSINKLPKTRKKIFELFQFKGYSYKQIATILDISPKTVDNHIYQAMKQLRKMMSAMIILLLLK